MRTVKLLAILVIGFIVLPESADAQLFGRKKKEEPVSKPTPEKKTIENTVKNSQKLDGLFTIYQDTTNGSTHMVIHEDQLDKEFIYFSHTVDGVIPAGHFRGQYRDNKVFKIVRHFDRIEFKTINTDFHFDDDNALSKASEANIGRSTLISEKFVLFDDEAKSYLIKSDGLFLTENMHQIKPTPFPGGNPLMQFNLGGLNKDKTKYLDIRNYPENTDVIVEFNYDNPSPVNSGGISVTDARSNGIVVQHSFIEMPKDNNFTMRRDDPRVGYFGQTVTSLTSTSPTPYNDVINRWNLVKKDPTAAMSEPVEPIVWWIENTTPIEFRETIANATLAWNEAFEAAGFLNAIEVRVQPDTADWDAGDMRYSVLRWTSSPQAPFGGYGPSFTNPRTGQILGADIMLEFGFFRSRLAEEELFTEEAMFNAADHDANNYTKYCSLGHKMQLNNLFGEAFISLNDMTNEDFNEYQRQALTMLILHELGHTFGLNHNMKASQLHSPTDIHNKELAETVGLTGSVMDYSTVNVAKDRTMQGYYYDVKPGPYDIWAIQYGYSQGLDDAMVEELRLNQILARSSEKQHFFGNDAEDMRAPGKAIDPRVMIGDMSSDAIAYGIERIELVSDMMQKLQEKYTRPGESYHRMRNAYSTLSYHYMIQAGVISRYIGGLYVDRSFADQPGAGLPYEPVEKEKQEAAMQALAAYVFAPDVFKAPAELLNYLQIQRRGFSLPGPTEDLKIHDQVLTMQKNVMNHILHPVVMKRITDTRLYGNEYELMQFMSDMTNAAFKVDMNGNVNTFRQNLQIEYVNRLLAIIANEGSMKYDTTSQSAALFYAKQLETQLKGKRSGNAETRAHTQHVLLLIDKALNS